MTKAYFHRPCALRYRCEAGTCGFFKDTLTTTGPAHHCQNFTHSMLLRRKVSITMLLISALLVIVGVPQIRRVENICTEHSGRPEITWI